MIYLLIKKIEVVLNHFCSHPVVHTLEVLTKVRSTICDHRMDGNELVHKEIRFVTLALLPLTQVGCGPRGLAKLELDITANLRKSKLSYRWPVQVPLAFGAVWPQISGHQPPPQNSFLFEMVYPPSAEMPFKQCTMMVKSGALRSRHIWICIPSLPLVCYLALGRLLNFSKLYFLMFKKGMATAPTLQGV